MIIFMGSKVVESLISYAKENDSNVKNVTIGVTWTCVLSKYCGVSMSYNTGNEDLDVKGFGYLEEKRVGELAEYLRSWNLLEASVGLAAINSVIEPKGNTEANGLDVALEIGKGKKIVMIGKFPGLQRKGLRGRKASQAGMDSPLIFKYFFFLNFING